jgi:hypothetical protein
MVSNLSHFRALVGAFGALRENCQLAYKPGFVFTGLIPQWMTIHLEHLLPNASRNQPGR